MDSQGKQAKPEYSGSRVSMFLFFILIAVIAVTAFLVYLKTQGVDLNNLNIREVLTEGFGGPSAKDSEKVVSEFKYDNAEYSAFATLNGYIVKCNRDSISGLGRDGSEEWRIGISMSKPVIKVSGSNLMVADIGGRDIYVLKGKAVKWNRKIQGNIINASISEDGYVSLVEEQNGYNGIVDVFDPDGQEIFTKGKADFYILDAKVSPSGKKVMINSVDTSGVSMDSEIETTDIYGKSIGNIKVENEIFPATWYMKNDSILTVSDSTAKCFDSEGKQVWPQAFRGDILTSGLSSGKYAVLAARKEGKAGLFSGSTTVVSILKPSGELNAEYETNGEVKNIETYNDTIALETDSEVFFINTRGRLIGKYSSETDITDVRFLSGNEAVLVTKDTVKIIKVG